MSKTKMPELLSPCGSWESLQAAIRGGCDAVYFGIEQLNMRARSTVNFTVEDLEQISSIARKNKIRTYITLNTIVYDHDMTLVNSILKAAKKYGIDAVIASDHAVMASAKKIGVPVHISTQANLTNIGSVEFYSQYADVMVLARELTLEQVGAITREIRRRKIKGPSGKLVQIEVFAHGALCMAVSGKCYLSLHSHFASANRGACIQNCRKSYIVTDKEDGTELEIDNEYIMSAKDLCTIGFLDKIVQAGVSVIKIEGRGRAEEYVYTATACYREALDALRDGTYSAERIKDWESRLSTVFNRGFWDGYYLGRTMGEWNNEYGSKSTKRKIYVGKGMKYFERIGVGEFKLESQSLKVGDEILISGPTTGPLFDTVKELRADFKIRDSVKKGEVFSMPVKEKIRPSDKLYKIVPA